MRFATLTVTILPLLGFALADASAEHELFKRVPGDVVSKCVGSAEKRVALTFDDGPYQFDPQLQAALAKHNAKATFFINQNNWGCAYADSRIKGMRDLFKAGHEFGSHTATHPHLNGLTWDQVHDQMWKVEELMVRVLGVSPALFRPPYGEYNANVKAVAAKRNQTIVLWDFDSGDSTGLTAAQSKALYKSQIVDKKVTSALALNHSVKNTTVSDVIPYALDILSKAGYKFVTVSQCLGIRPYQYTRAQGVKDASWKC